MIDPPSSSTVTVVVGDSFTLFCTSRGSPPDTFTWMKDGGPLLNSTSITPVTYTNSSAVFYANLSIDAVVTSDNGLYTCIVVNPIGTSNETINVTVVGKYVRYWSILQSQKLTKKWMHNAIYSTSIRENWNLTVNKDHINKKQRNKGGSLHLQIL